MKRIGDSNRVEGLQELLTLQLGDLLYMEKKLVKALEKLSKEVSNPQIRSRIEQHREETMRHVEVVGEAFKSIGAKEKSEKCDGILGVIEEHDTFKSDEKPAKEILEVFDLGAGLRAEYYEIAAYRSTISLAESLGQSECVKLLKQNLSQEESLAQFLEQNAPNVLQAMLGAQGQQIRQSGLRPM